MRKYFALGIEVNKSAKVDDIFVKESLDKINGYLDSKDISRTLLIASEYQGYEKLLGFDTGNPLVDLQPRDFNLIEINRFDREPSLGSIGVGGYLDEETKELKFKSSFPVDFAISNFFLDATKETPNNYLLGKKMVTAVSIKYEDLITRDPEFNALNEAFYRMKGWGTSFISFRELSDFVEQVH